ncbi:Transcriptional regulatory protein PrrA [bacterium HR12]|nr:Transcriptional regulatory protein PrrA [bacterium HR12]
MGATRPTIDGLFEAAALPSHQVGATHVHPPFDLTPSTIAWGPFTVDLRARVARWGDRPLGLTPLELRVFASLVWARGAVLSHATLAELVWGRSAPGDDERLHAHVRRIRRKLEAAGCTPTCLRSVRGEGYRLTEGGVDDG